MARKASLLKYHVFPLNNRGEYMKPKDHKGEWFFEWEWSMSEDEKNYILIKSQDTGKVPGFFHIRLANCNDFPRNYVGTTRRIRPGHKYRTVACFIDYIITNYENHRPWYLSIRKLFRRLTT